MNRAEQDLDTAKNTFRGHVARCDSCKNMDPNKTKTLVSLCFFGTQLYKAMIKAQDAIAEGKLAKESAKRQAKIRRENMKSLFN